MLRRADVVKEPPLSLNTLRDEVSELVDVEIKESSNVIDPAQDYLQEHNYQLEEVEGLVKMTKRQGKQM